MKRKLDLKENELYKRIDEVLHYVWDPIGISDEPWARDEYESRVPQVFSLVVNQATPQAIADHLMEVVRKDMEVTSNERHTMRVAELLLAYREKIFGEDS